jgi:alpha-ketoglutarate-dependent 2,4-dichlorophenoxyacetate dioxygenase
MSMPGSRGDVLIWDERAMLHRGRPWPYGEERTLASICVSAQDSDGLDQVRP